MTECLQFSHMLFLNVQFKVLCIMNWDSSKDGSAMCIKVKNTENYSDLTFSSKNCFDVRLAKQDLASKTIALDPQWFAISYNNRYTKTKGYTLCIYQNEQGL